MGHAPCQSPRLLEGVTSLVTPGRSGPSASASAKIAAPLRGLPHRLAGPRSRGGGPALAPGADRLPLRKRQLADPVEVHPVSAASSANALPQLKGPAPRPRRRRPARGSPPARPAGPSPSTPPKTPPLGVREPPDPRPEVLLEWPGRRPLRRDDEEGEGPGVGSPVGRRGLGAEGHRPRLAREVGAGREDLALAARGPGDRRPVRRERARRGDMLEPPLQGRHVAEPQGRDQ